MQVSQLKVANTELPSLEELVIAFAKKDIQGLFEASSIYASWQLSDYNILLLNKEKASELTTELEANNVDFASLESLPDTSKPGVALFDMDSTLIEIECIDEIAKLAGVGEEVSEVTERAMQGELDFEQSLRQRVGKLEGAPDSILEQVRVKLPVMDEAKLLIDGLKSLGWKVALASGGFTYFSDSLKETLGLDYARSNQLEIINGVLTGKVLGDVVSADTKAEVLRELRDKYGIDKSNSVAVGDGANDLV
ncbi:phosphoserine phosphatase [Vibrio ishigakensis]|uniref:Phosphoserine phosphatase n=1 Tax=Vibrio ishigakensis TaxID=1481914 RepID=A0A0B8QN99_9VIBR|nr:phosphoserine phosphatase [Vibrio ishigakensis]